MKLRDPFLKIESFFEDFHQLTVVHCINSICISSIVIPAAGVVAKIFRQSSNANFAKLSIHENQVKSQIRSHLMSSENFG